MDPAPMAADRTMMRRALVLAERGWGRVHPNPLVGAVVVREGEVVGEGFHGEYGGPHAEVVALEAAGERARGADLYVTLEPCAHAGKTPPCTEAILAAGVRRVIVAAEDPNPLARGGADRLRGAGIAVVLGVEREEARTQNAAFFHAIEREATWVALKYGLSLDARLGTTPDRPTEVTGAEARAEVHRLRAGFDALMIGCRTALADDPLLTVRGVPAPRVPPVRVVVDTAARLPVASRLVQTAREAPLWILCAEDAPAERRRALEHLGARTLAVPGGEGGVALDGALGRLWAEGVRSLFCEGGGRLGAALLASDLVQRLHLFFAPRLFGEGGVAAFPGAFGGSASGWRLRRLQAFGDDTHMMLDRDG